MKLGSLKVDLCISDYFSKKSAYVCLKSAGFSDSFEL